MNLPKTVFISVLLLLATESVLAQVMPEYKRAGTNIKCDGEKLSSEEKALLLSNIGGVDYTLDWDKYSKQYNWGLGLLIGGATCTAVGVGGAFIYILAEALAQGISAGQVGETGLLNKAGWLFYGVGGVGVLSAGVGTGLLISSAGNMKSIIKLLPNGAGFALNF